MISHQENADITKTSALFPKLFSRDQKNLLYATNFCMWLYKKTTGLSSTEFFTDRFCMRPLGAKGLMGMVNVDYLNNNNNYKSQL